MLGNIHFQKYNRYKRKLSVKGHNGKAFSIYIFVHIITFFTDSFHLKRLKFLRTADVFCLGSRPPCYSINIFPKIATVIHFENQYVD